MLDEHDGRFADPTPLHDPDVDVFLSEQEEEFDWLIPGVLERGDRMILTGREGAGKSMLLQQIAMQSAAGIHPFTCDETEPLRVLMIDCENSSRELRRRLRPLRLQANSLPAQHLFVFSRPEGLDLGTGGPESAEDRGWFEERLSRIKPDLVITGPIYKLAFGDPNDEKQAKPLAMYLDRLRAEHGFALILEAHMPHDTKGRPYGWSGWRRWPEIGVEIREGGGLIPWRPARHETPSLPLALERGGTWPFSPTTRDRDVVWSRIVAYREDHPTKPTLRELAGALGIGKSTVERVLKEHEIEWEAMNE